ncbi:MAG: menaquinone biosynthesis protein [Verrucomicrobiae bacterium]
MSLPRLGCVPYLNARPLLHGLVAELATPAVLSERFAAGCYDAALLPVYETLRLPQPRIVDGFGIGSFGPVQSVVVVHRQPLDQVPEIVLDPASRTSSHLLRVLLAKRLRISPPLVEKSANPHAARLIIGDPAMEFQRGMDATWRVLDLGRAWHDWTGLPFVFAVWTLAENAPPQTANLLREAARAGFNARREIAAREPDPAAALDYLTRSIRYPIGEPEKLAIRKFGGLLVSCRLLPATVSEPVFV